ncbi:MAG: diacylglycerol kinase family protein [Oscillospiraceae bacterium]|nr:diacylglycerol kinase family protein [Oscillospiraceae bacterium]
MKFLRSFTYAARGIAESVRTGRNLRFQIVATVYVFLLAPHFLQSREEWAILCVVVALVLAGELFNTALERLTDHTAHGFSMLARAAKDAAAGAVLVASLFAVAVGVLLLSRAEGWQAFLRFCANFPLYPAALIVLLVPSWIFVFMPKK